MVRSQISPAAKSISCPGTPLKRGFAAAPPPPPPAEPAAQESFLNGTSGAYVEEMFEAWSLDPKSVHVSWDAYFRGGAYQVSGRVKARPTYRYAYQGAQLLIVKNPLKGKFLSTKSFKK